MGKFKDLTGQRFGRLVALKMVKDGSKKIKWLCKCDCGNEKVVAAWCLTSGNTKSCGCLKRENSFKDNRTTRIRDLTGQRFGRLVALDYKSSHDKQHLVWRCKCDCGNETFVASSSLVTGTTKSCGCLRKEVSRTIKKDVKVVGVEDDGRTKRTISVLPKYIGEMLKKHGNTIIDEEIIEVLTVEGAVQKIKEQFGFDVEIVQLLSGTWIVTKKGKRR